MLDNDGKGGGTLEHDRHEIIVEEITPSYGRIVLEPLERGYGITLGNALRRVLLSSIPGASISAVRIEGVLHEFSTVPGVREDMIELLVNGFAIALIGLMVLLVYSDVRRLVPVFGKNEAPVAQEDVGGK